MERESPEWLLDDNGLYEYYLEDNREGNTHHKAELACTKLGGILASVKSSSTQAFIEKIIPPAKPGNGTRQFWIGVHRETETSSWVWEDGAPVNFSNWYPNEEIQSSEFPENCGSIFTSTFNYKWFSNHCEGNQFGYICQRPAGGFPTTSSLLTTLKQNLTKSNVVLEAQASNVVVQVVLPILLALLLLLLIIGTIYSHRKKQCQFFCKWAPMSPTPQQPKATNEYVDLPPGQTTNEEDNLEPQAINQESYLQIVSEMRTKPKSKSHLDNPTYMQLDIPSRSKTLQSDDYTILRSVEPTKMKHSSSEVLINATAQQQSNGYMNVTAENKHSQSLNHFKTSKQSASSERDVYVDVYSLPTKMKKKSQT